MTSLCNVATESPAVVLSRMWEFVLSVSKRYFIGLRVLKVRIRKTHQRSEAPLGNFRIERVDAWSVSPSSNPDFRVWLTKSSKCFAGSRSPILIASDRFRRSTMSLTTTLPRRLHQRGVAWFRCSTGLIVAKLLGAPGYETLASFYVDVMKRDNKGFYLKYFKSLLTSLEDVKPPRDEQIANLTIQQLPSVAQGEKSRRGRC